jgi:hypothetical protein
MGTIVDNFSCDFGEVSKGNTIVVKAVCVSCCEREFSTSVLALCVLFFDVFSWT